MELVRWRPRQGILSAHEDMNRMMDRFLRGWSPADPYSELGAYPRVDIAENDDAFVVSAELPGVSEDDIEINVVDGQLVISGEKKQEEKEEGKGYYRVERCYGAFRRVFSLPSRVDVEKMEAEFDTGVLSITIPKVGEAKSKKIEIRKKA